MHVVKKQEASEFHAPNLLERKASVYMDQKIGVGRGSYGKGMAAPFHAHKGGEIMYIISGKGVFGSREKEVIAEPGTMLYFGPDEEHMLANRWDEPLVFLWFYPDVTDVETIKKNWVKVA